MRFVTTTPDRAGRVFVHGNCNKSWHKPGFRIELAVMEKVSTVLLVSPAHEERAAVKALLTEQYGYRVLHAISASEARGMLTDAHVDLVIAEEGDDGPDGLALLSGLRVSHPELIRVLALPAHYLPVQTAISQASVYQFLRKPLDPQQVGLVVKRGLEAHELAKRHRLLAREFKLSSDLMEFERPVPTMRNESLRFEKLVYVSEKMTEVCDLARKPPRPISPS